MRGTANSAWVCKEVTMPCRFCREVPSALFTLSLSTFTPRASSIFLPISSTRPFNGVLSVMNCTTGSMVLLISHWNLFYTFCSVQVILWLGSDSKHLREPISGVPICRWPGSLHPPKVLFCFEALEPSVAVGPAHCLAITASSAKAVCIELLQGSLPDLL